MKTVKEVIAYLEDELAEAYEMHDNATDKQERLLHIVRAVTIASILDEIKR